MFLPQVIMTNISGNMSSDTLPRGGTDAGSTASARAVGPSFSGNYSTHHRANYHHFVIIFNNWHKIDF